MGKVMMTMKMMEMKTSKRMMMTTMMTTSTHNLVRIPRWMKLKSFVTVVYPSMTKKEAI